MIFDAWGFLACAPHWLVYLSGLIGLLLAGWWLTWATKRIYRLTGTIEGLGNASLDDKGRPLFDYRVLIEIREQLVRLRDDFENHADLFTEHHADVARVANGDPWKTCLVEHCPNLSAIIHKIDLLIKLFDSFDDKAQQSREATGATLSQISLQITEIARQLSSDAVESRKTTQESLKNIVDKLDLFLSQAFELAMKERGKK